MWTVFKTNDVVRIKKYPEDSADGYGRVDMINHTTGKIRVVNMNMPFCGSVCDWFNPEELSVQRRRK